jgi:hypothetical protein
VEGGYRDFAGFVEPCPAFFERLGFFAARAGAMFGPGSRFGRRGFVETEESERAGGTRVDFAELGRICMTLALLATKELNGEPFNAEEEEFLKDFGKTLAVLQGESENTAQCPLRHMALISDVCTETGIFKKCIEAATGPAMRIHVIVNAGGRAVLTQGGVYSYFEFAQPMDQRLTDAEWKARIRAGRLQDLEDWQRLYAARDETRWFAERVKDPPRSLLENPCLALPEREVKAWLAGAIPSPERFESVEVRRFALEYLWRGKHVEEADAAPLLKDPDFEIRFRAAWEHRRKAGPEALAVFREGLEKPAPETRFKSVLGLFYSGDTTLLDLLIQGIGDKSLSPEVRRSIGTAIQERWQMLTPDQIERMSLGSTSESADFPFRYARKFGLKAKKVFENLFLHPDPYVRWFAFRDFVAIAGPEDRLAAARALADDPYPATRELARLVVAREGKEPGDGGK